MTAVDLATLQPLFPRHMYSDTDYQLAATGRCLWYIGAWSHPHCGAASDPCSKFRLCADHDAQARTDYPDEYANPDQHVA